MDKLTQALEEAARIAPRDANREAAVWRHRDGLQWLVLPTSSGLMGQVGAEWTPAYTVRAL